MKKNTAIWIIVIVLIVIVGAVIWMNHTKTMNSVTPPADTSLAPTSDQTTASGTVVLASATSAALGAYLVASNGMTLYTDSQDAAGVSTCTAACATAWPPYAVSGAGSFIGGAGVTGAVATITRADGTMQVTYNGMPLYFWQGDTKAGDVTGQNVNGFSVATP